MNSMMNCQLFVDLTRRKTKITTSDSTPMRHGNAWIRELIGTLEECSIRKQEIEKSWGK